MNKYLVGQFAYRSSGADYAFEFAVGSIGGSSGGSRTFVKDTGGIITSSGVSDSSVSVNTDPVGFTSARRVRYDATIASFSIRFRLILQAWRRVRH